MVPATPKNTIQEWFEEHEKELKAFWDGIQIPQISTQINRELAQQPLKDGNIVMSDTSEVPRPGPKRSELFCRYEKDQQNFRQVVLTLRQWCSVVLLLLKHFLVLTVLSNSAAWTVVPPLVIWVLCLCPLNVKQPMISIWLHVFIRHFSLKYGWVPATSAISRERDRRGKINI